jgi:hypothetical protein
MNVIIHTEVNNYYGELRALTTGRRNEAQLSRILAEWFMMQLGVYWEVFASDLIVAYVRADKRTFMTKLSRRVKKVVEGEFGIHVRRLIAVERRLPDAAQSIEALVDPRERNLSSGTTGKLREVTNKHLNARHAKKFVLRKSDGHFVDMLVSFRNYLAHRSRSARAHLQERIRCMSETSENAGMYIRPLQLDRYLTGSSPPYDQRVLAIADRLKAIAERL